MLSNQSETKTDEVRWLSNLVTTTCERDRLHGQSSRSGRKDLANKRGLPLSLSPSRPKKPFLGVGGASSAFHVRTIDRRASEIDNRSSAQSSPRGGLPIQG